MTLTARRTTAGLLCLALLAAVAAVGTWPGTPRAAGSSTLNGTFRLTPGTYSGGKPTTG